MKIRNKVIGLLSAVFLILALVEWGVEEVLLLPGFEQIELEAARTAMTRIDYAVNQSLAGLQVSANDWGSWLPSYQYMADRNDTFVRENLNPTALKQLHLTALVYIDLDGHVVASRALDATTGVPTELDLFPTGSLPSDFPWLDNLRQARPAQGLLVTRNGVMLAAVSPVLDGPGGHGAPRGMLFMGRVLTAAEVADFGAHAQTAVALAAMRRAGEPPLVASRAAAAAGTDPVTQSRDMTYVLHSFDDIYGKPAMTLRVEVPRTISARAKITIAYARTFTFGAGIAVLLLILLVLDREVLAPLSHVTGHASAIAAGDDLSNRLNLKRTDEIGTLASEFDRMVERVAESRARLIDLSFDSGRAELSRGILHNIGNAMTPLGVRIARLQGRLRDAPVTDVRRALAERNQQPEGSERQADLDAFVRLAAAELADAVGAAEEDAAVIARQSGLVQAALSDQMRSARGTNVIEAVDLKVLVDQSLEIIPDACREQAAITLDPSLQSVGPVRVARTVLRLVLQNLMINASEATRSAGRGRGIVRLSASKSELGGAEQLLLTCEDAGIGIAAADLERVFERGFSTKGDSGNRGIGLHWCATSVSSLGGRIWATSDGPGRGARFHVQIPLANPAMATATEAA